MDVPEDEAECCFIQNPNTEKSKPAIINHALIGKTISNKFLNKTGVKNILTTAWSNYQDFKISDVEDNVFLITFKEGKEADEVMKKAPWFVMNQLFNLVRWEQDKGHSEMNFEWAPFWVQVHDLPLELFDENTLRRVMARVGEIIEVEKPLIGGMLQHHYMRARILVNTYKPLWSGIWIERENLPKKWINFRYERLQGLCFQCGCLGHDHKSCHICNIHEETAEHALLLCAWVSPIWFGLGISEVPTPHAISSITIWLQSEEEKAINHPKGPIFVIARIAITLWFIWCERNRSLFDGCIPSPIGTMIKCQNLLLELDQLSPNPAINLQAPPVRPFLAWRPPLPGSLKVNVDASFFPNTGKGAGGIVIRNHKGGVESLLATRIYATSCLMAEALACRDAVSLASSLGIERVIIESDCLDLIKAWTQREGNSVANSIAKTHATTSLPRNWSVFIPSEVAACIAFDANRISVDQI